MNHDPRQHPEWLQRDADLHRPLCAEYRRRRTLTIWLSVALTVGMILGMAIMEQSA